MRNWPVFAPAGDRRDFILADAKDADMAFGVAAPGPNRGLAGSGRASKGCWKSLEDYRQQIRAIVAQGIVDLMLLSASTLEKLAIEERLFESSAVTRRRGPMTRPISGTCGAGNIQRCHRDHIARRPSSTLNTDAFR